MNLQRLVQIGYKSLVCSKYGTRFAFPKCYVFGVGKAWIYTRKLASSYFSRLKMEASFKWFIILDTTVVPPSSVNIFFVLFFWT